MPKNVKRVSHFSSLKRRCTFYFMINLLRWKWGRAPILIDILTCSLLFSKPPYLISKLQHWIEVTFSMERELCGNEVLYAIAQITCLEKC